MQFVGNADVKNVGKVDITVEAYPELLKLTFVSSNRDKSEVLLTHLTAKMLAEALKCSVYVQEIEGMLPKRR